MEMPMPMAVPTAVARAVCIVLLLCSTVRHWLPFAFAQQYSSGGGCDGAGPADDGNAHGNGNLPLVPREESDPAARSLQGLPTPQAYNFNIAYDALHIDIVAFKERDILIGFTSIFHAIGSNFAFVSSIFHMLVPV